VEQVTLNRHFLRFRNLKASLKELNCNLQDLLKSCQARLKDSGFEEHIIIIKFNEVFVAIADTQVLRLIPKIFVQIFSAAVAKNRHDDRIFL